MTNEQGATAHGSLVVVVRPGPQPGFFLLSRPEPKWTLRYNVGVWRGVAQDHARCFFFWSCRDERWSWPTSMPRPRVGPSGPKSTSTIHFKHGINPHHTRADKLRPSFFMSLMIGVGMRPPPSSPPARHPTHQQNHRKPGLRRRDGDHSGSETSCQTTLSVPDGTHSVQTYLGHPDI